ncbi:hypothetical protein ACRDU6_00220 (plasmid) [Mycolicibacterium sp. ELW1]|uniref:hypothetical protein n=1 Tax=Mycobacteriaceae TaxID=1762 RepID=UPI0011EF3ACC|nr:hypothetical protein [Mycobacterium sp. ELW1]QEN17591.1 hypothetical protein D3H54_30430 [Mycobacterium sp. ELW1]
MSRDFDRVGVGLSAHRLREISAGAPAGDDEVANIDFALLATGIAHEERQERLAQLQASNSRLIRLNIALAWVLLVLIAAGLVLTAHHDFLTWFTAGGR